jgi:hypothetical protein
LIENSDTGVRGTDYDGINVAGILTIDAAATSDLVFNGASSNVDFNDAFWDEDQSWQVFIAGTFSGPDVFSVQSISEDSNGLALAANRGFFTWNAVGNEVHLEYTAVPEPSSFALLSLGLIGIGIHRRRRKSKADQSEDSDA